MSGKRMRECLLVLLVGLFSASLLPAQNATGSIVGHVKDQVGASVAGAQVIGHKCRHARCQNGDDDRVGRLHGPCLAAGAL